MKRKRTRSSPPAASQGLRRLPLGSLRVFVAAAQQRSFTRAASVLGVSAAAVSMQIRALEEYLRLPLFVRRGRTVALSGEGERLMPRLERALIELERAVDEARLERRSGAVTVSMLSSFLQQWLLPRLPDFQRRHPAVDLRLHTSTEPVDFLRSDVQAAIRFGAGQWAGVDAQKVLEEYLVPVATPALVERHGPIADRSDLERYPLLHSKSETWQEWLDGSAREAWAERGATFDDSVAVLRAAAAGQGLALARWSLVSLDVSAGRLAIASRKVLPVERAYYFVCPGAYLALEKIQAFRDWLMQQARDSPPPPLPPRSLRSPP